VNPLTDKTFLVRVVNGRGTNVHIHDKERKRVLHIWWGGKYKLLSQLIDYVTENGRYKVIKTYYKPENHIYFNNAWEMTLTTSQIINLLYITRHNNKSRTLQRVMDFITEL